MRRTVTQWTTLQDLLFIGDDLPPEHVPLWELIERRTFGKRWSDPIAIRLTKAQEQQLLDLEESAN